MISSNKSAIVEVALLFFGTRYRWGGNTPWTNHSGCDCSALVAEVLRSLGYIGDEDYTAQGLHNYLCIGKSQISPIESGALLFFGTSKMRISHVAIAINQLLMIEAGGGDRNTKTEEDAVRDNAYVRIRPIKRRSDLISVLKLDELKGAVVN